jgi:hypothetical protein
VKWLISLYFLLNVDKCGLVVLWLLNICEIGLAQDGCQRQNHFLNSGMLSPDWKNRIDDLETKVHWVKTSKNSGNSSLPLSSNFGKPAQKLNQSLRKGSDRKTGD